MEATHQSTDIFRDQPRQLPGMLNTLTILTFIGCGLSYLGLIWSYFTASNYQEQVAQMEEMQDRMGDNGIASNMMQGSVEMLQKTYEYRHVTFITGLIFTTLCLVGAMQMRKLKKSGFTLYAIGELAPLVVTAALIGFSFVGGLTVAFSALFAIIFVVLYSTQRKYLVH